MRLLQRLLLRFVFFALFGVSLFLASATETQELNRDERSKIFIGTRATYCSAPRKADGRVDVEKLVAELVEVGANTYSFCIHAQATDWDDLKLILPRAREKRIRIWASIVPPSESPPRTKSYAEPFRLDYERWAVEFAKLSLRETNLVAWSIDDFTHNLKFYTPDYLHKMLEAQRHIAPRLAFVPCCYFPVPHRIRRGKPQGCEPRRSRVEENQRSSRTAASNHSGHLCLGSQSLRRYHA